MNDDDRYIEEFWAGADVLAAELTASGQAPTLEEFLQDGIDRARGAPLQSAVTVRLSGPGVSGHAVPLNAAADVLAGVQKVLDALGQAHAQPPTASGKISASLLGRTQLLLSPRVTAGSAVFHLDVTSDIGTLPAVAGSAAISRALDDLDLVVASADTGVEKATDTLRPFGPRVAGHLSTLSRALVDHSLDLDVALRKADSTRRRTSLSRQAAGRLLEAVAANEHHESVETVTGTLSAVSTDGRLRLQTSTGTLPLAAPDLQLDDMRALFGSTVLARVHVETTWAKGRERSTYTLLSAGLADAVA